MIQYTDGFWYAFIETTMGRICGYTCIDSEDAEQDLIRLENQYRDIIIKDRKL